MSWRRCSSGRKGHPARGLQKVLPLFFSMAPAGGNFVPPGTRDGFRSHCHRGTFFRPPFSFRLAEKTRPAGLCRRPTAALRRHLGRRQTGRGRSSSTQVTHRSFRRKRQNSLIPLRLLSPQNLRFCGGSIKGALWQTEKDLSSQPSFYRLSPKPVCPLLLAPRFPLR